MLSKIVIKNYKSYIDFSLDFNQDINIIVGDNEAGKSTLLEAINLVLTCQMNSRHISNEITPYIFNTSIVAEYLESIVAKNPTALPSILIEAYFDDPEKQYSSLKGTNNTLNEDCPGVYLSLEFDSAFEEEYKAYIADEKKITTIPIEYYTFKWMSFSNNSITFRSIPLNSTLIDTSTIKLQNGTDKYVAKIIQDTLEIREKTELSLQYRKLKESFASIPAIEEINTNLNSKKGDITDKTLTISVDISQRSNWDSILTSYLDDVPFDFIGKGEQSSIKMKMALESELEKLSVIMIEEPENHLSYANMNKLISSIKERNVGKQVILTTHSSFILNKLDISKMILLHSNKTVMTFDNLDSETKKFFMKLPGYDTLRIILCKKVILVEGPSDELIVQRAYKDLYKKLPIEDGVDIFCVDALSFKRFLDLSIGLKKPIYVITDNDGDIEKNINQKYEGYIDNDYVNICFDSDEAFQTLEPQLLKANQEDTSILKKIMGHEKYTDNRLVQYMINSKTECALKIFEAKDSIKMPRYIINAIQK
ncbi:ATP-dependent nuclease [Peribacillus frigoritolerans]|uniref:ATP-dependent nuclease n=1 Tax=Peribacillus frigoritolerans TaxID=450367 RepID=UPI0020792F90|nr:AAA family ATPase [Peribacillus frigoritolerans]MEE3953494.1 AAA family ATPase [Peribacillus frigoritolerans]USK63464.1 AAA family ATPase [Peribacillus frigoritolerans]